MGGRYGKTLPLTITFRAGSAEEVGLDKKTAGIMIVPDKLKNHKLDEGNGTAPTQLVQVESASQADDNIEDLEDMSIDQPVSPMMNELQPAPPADPQPEPEPEPQPEPEVFAPPA